jgi:hypothetical protein
MHFSFNPYKRNQALRQSNVDSLITNRFSFFAYSNPAYTSTCDLTVDIPSIYSIQSENDIDVIIKIIKIFLSFFFFYLFRRNIMIDQQMHHKYVQVKRNMNVCKHLFYHLMKKETFQYLQRKLNAVSFYFEIFFSNMSFF